MYTYVTVPEFSRMQCCNDVTGVQWDSGMQLMEREIQYGYGYGYGYRWVYGYGYGYRMGSDHFNAWSCLLMKSNDLSYIKKH